MADDLGEPDQTARRRRSRLLWASTATVLVLAVGGFAVVQQARADAGQTRASGSSAGSSAAAARSSAAGTTATGAASASVSGTAAATAGVSATASASAGAPTSSAATSAASAAAQAQAKAASAAASASTSTPVGGTGTTWTQVFYDDFTTSFPLGGWSTSPYTDRWLAYQGFNDTSKNGVYDPIRVMSASGGVLDWYVHTVGGQHLVSALMPLKGAGQVYGRYSFRFRADSLPGYKIAFLLWPDSENWGDGEIDFPETDQLIGSEQFYSSLHAPNPGSATPQPSIITESGVSAASAPGTGWHVATIEWLPGSLTFTMDGKTVARHTSGVPTTSMHYVFQVETNLSGVPPSDDVAGHVQLDWVRIDARS